ncbi:aminopeptidase [Methanosarcinales archaeon]|nr:MAG: aminopeptidase [Methanosarcinales archaeon]
MKSLKTMLFPGLILLVVFSFQNFATGQEKEEKEEKKDAYEFTIVKEVARTPMKNQASTSTCWCFATISFLESELLRTGKEEIDLSEMYIVRHTYPEKAKRYIRLHGETNFPHGGACHDLIDQMRIHGLVPEEVYTGLNYGEKKHNHGELGSILKSMVDAVVRNRGKRVTPRWYEAFENVLDIYLGEVPTSFTYKGKKYTPKTFLTDYLELNPDDYIEITSYTHHPFYTQFYLELPDNWTFNDRYYNVPIEDLERIVDNALNNGYSVVYGGDVSNKFFSGKKGYGIVPLKDWEDMTEKERKDGIKEPVEEKKPTQELRQKWFDNYTATDDHAMHIVGIAKDQKGHTFYLTKNSWGTDKKYDGYVYLSKPYILLNATGFMVNKNSIPEDIRKKMGI